MHTRQAQVALLAAFAPCAFALCVLALPACGEKDDPPGGDAGADAAPEAPIPDDGGRPLSVAPAAPPVLTPCPDGWRVVSAEGEPDICDPWPAEGPPVCTGSEGALPGMAGCVRFGTECPADGWPEGLPGDVTVLHVRAGAPAGDGTRTLPFATVTEALAVAPEGAVVAISPGAYVTGLVITTPVTLWGACPEVVLSAESISSAVRVAARGVVIANLRIDGSLGAVTANMASLELREVVVTGPSRSAISLSHGDLVIDGLLVRDVGGGPALSINSSTAMVRRVSVERTHEGLTAGAMGSVTIEDGALLNSFGGSAVTAVFASGGQELSLRRVAIRGGGTTTLAFEAQILLEDVVMEGEPADVPASSPGVVGLDRAVLGLRRVRLDRLRLTGLGIVEAESRLEASHVLIRDVVPDPIEGGGHGFETGLGASAVLDRLWIAGARGIGVFATDGASAVIARDLTVRDTTPDRVGTFGRALQVQLGASMVGTRLSFSDNREATVVVAGAGAEATLVDVTVQRTAERACAEMGCPGAGVGIGTYLGGHADVERFIVTNAALAGVQIARDGSMDLREGQIADNPVGANIQVPDYDIDRLTDRVAYERNGVNLDATELPTPGATATGI